MKAILGGAVVALLMGATSAYAQQAAAPAEPQPFAAGKPLGSTTRDGVYTPASDNVKMYGALVSTESCSYDATRNLIVAPNRGANQNQAPNDAFVSLINHDGSVNTPKWIGTNRNGLVLNQPFGSDIEGGKLYLADSDGGTADGAKQFSVIRMFDMETGAPAGEIQTPDVTWFNDIEVAADGTIYASQTGGGQDNVPQRIYKIAPDGTQSIFLDGPPLASPNGVAFDKDGNIVIVNIGDDAVLTFSPAGELLNTEHAAQAGNDGLVVMPDGTKYVSSVINGGVSKIEPGKPGELIASGVPSAASMCYDPEANQLVIPLNNNNGMAFIKLD